MALNDSTERVTGGFVRDLDGRLIVVGPDGVPIGGGEGGSSGTIDAPADAKAPTLAQHTQGFLSGWNGTNWDRLRSSIANGLVVDVSRVQGTVQTISTPTPDTTATGTITANGQTVAGAVPAGMATYSVLVSGAAYAGVNLTFEATADGASWALVQMAPVAGGTPVTATGVITSNATVYYEGAIPAAATQVRVRATAYTSGTANIRIGFSPAGYEAAPTVTGAVAVTGTATVSGTVTASNTAGSVAHDGVDAGNPVKVGGHARTTDRTAVASADRTDFITDTLGKQVGLPYAIPDLMVSGRANLTNTTSTAIIAAGAAGVRNYVTTVLITNNSATVATKVSILDGVTVLMTVACPINGGGVAVSLPVPLRGTAATAINAQCATTGADVEVVCIGYRAAN